MFGLRRFFFTIKKSFQINDMDTLLFKRSIRSRAKEVVLARSPSTLPMLTRVGSSAITQKV